MAPWKSIIFFGLLAYGAFKTKQLCSLHDPPHLEPQWWGPGSPPAKEDTSVKSIKVQVSDVMLQDFKRRLDNARFPVAPLEGINFQYGFNVDTLKKIVDFWRNNYNWKDREVLLNKYSHFTTEIQGLDIHFMHIKPAEETAQTIPLLLMNGWPSSIKDFFFMIEFLRDIKFTNGLAFELIVPSLPGYAWSSAPAKPGCGPAQMAFVMRGLMQRLGYKQWYIHGSDWGSMVATNMAIYFPNEVLGLHNSMCVSMTKKTLITHFLASFWPSLFMEERFAKKLYPYGKQFENLMIESGYMHLQATKPDTVGVGLADSPIGLAAYILEKFSTGTNVTYRTLPDGALTEKYTYEDLLDNVMIFWWTNCMTSSMRIYAENFAHTQRSLNLENVPVKVPMWCARFPSEIFYQPDWMLKHKYPMLAGVSDMASGGHFAAFEVPKIMAQDVVKAVQHFELKRKGTK